MTTEYVAGIDEPMRLAKTITVESEKEADETYAVSQKHALPVGYIVKAVVRCNQLDPFRMVACDWSVTIESRRENVEMMCRRRLGLHFRHAHPYMTHENRVMLQQAVQMNFRDAGR